MRLLAPSLVGLCLATLTPSLMAGGREPGSVLIFPVHRSGDTEGFFTIVSVTNTNLHPATILSLGGSTNLHFEYVNVTPNQQNPFRPLGCTIFDRVEALTPADTISVLTGCHNAVFAPGQSGYLVVTAENPSLFQTAWSHNDLLGSELVLSATGISYSLEAIAVRSPKPQGAPTDFNNNDRLDFDGVEYETLPDRLYIDSFIAVAEASLTLINLTGTELDTNTVLFSVWNDFEFPLSTSLVFKCWFDQRLSAISTLFTNGFLVNVPNDPDELDVNCDNVDDFETGWAIIQSTGVRAPGGALVSPDGAILGAITANAGGVNGGRLLAESRAKQANGGFSH